MRRVTTPRPGTTAVSSDVEPEDDDTDTADDKEDEAGDDEGEVAIDAPLIDEEIVDEDEGDDMADDEDEDEEGGPLHWSKFTQPEYISYHNGFPPGTTLQDLLPLGQTGVEVEVVLSAASAECGDDEGCFWEKLKAGSEKLSGVGKEHWVRGFM